MEITESKEQNENMISTQKVDPINLLKQSESKR